MNPVNELDRSAAGALTRAVERLRASMSLLPKRMRD